MMLESYKKLNTSDWMEIGRELLAYKKQVRAAYPSDSIYHERRAARLFYDYAEVTHKLKEQTARNLIRNYERFGASHIRDDLERAFTTSELTMLAARTDDEVAAALGFRLANPQAGREELRAYLKSTTAKHVLDH
ncbi:hypothetical protein [Caballeronia grimmiae]|uniref:hypothetical protein n=1 Tax=Caballeronia grimmiae TaxID=1071679 RepID=UPI0038BB30C2